MLQVSQNMDSLWIFQAGGSANDAASSVTVDRGGTVAIAGTFSSSTVTFGDYVLYNSAGGSSATLNTDLLLTEFANLTAHLTRYFWNFLLK